MKRIEIESINRLEFLVKIAGLKKNVLRWYYSSSDNSGVIITKYPLIYVGQ